MKKHLSFIFFLISYLALSQNYFENGKFLGYSKVITTEYKYDINKKWKTEFIINEFGDISEIKKYDRFKNDKLKSSTKLIYNDKRKLIKKISFYISKYDNKKSDIKEILFEYDSIGNLIKTKYPNNRTDYYFDYYNGKPKRIRFESTISPTESLIEYDDKGNITKIIERTDATTVYINTTTNTEKKVKNTYIQILSFEYNERNDIIKIERNSIPKGLYPHEDVDNFKTIYAVENYQYEYNKKGYWIKKYQVINNQKTLIEQRIYE